MAKKKLWFCRGDPEGAASWPDWHTEDPDMYRRPRYTIAYFRDEAGWILTPTRPGAWFAKSGESGEYWGYLVRSVRRPR